MATTDEKSQRIEKFDDTDDQSWLQKSVPEKQPVPKKQHSTFEKEHPPAKLLDMGIHNVNLFSAFGKIFDVEHSSKAELLERILSMRDTTNDPYCAYIIVGSSGYTDREINELEQCDIIYIKKEKNFNELHDKEKEKFITNIVSKRYTQSSSFHEPQAVKKIDPLYTHPEHHCWSNDAYVALKKRWKD